MAEQRQTSTAACKQEAVRLVPDHPHGVAETARNLGINVHRLRRWKQEYTAHTAACPGNGPLTPAQEARRQLRAKNTRLKMEREIVKTAMRFFVNELK
jgi:transposase-like protein